MMDSVLGGTESKKEDSEKNGSSSSSSSSNGMEIEGDGEKEGKEKSVEEGDLERYEIVGTFAETFEVTPVRPRYPQLHRILSQSTYVSHEDRVSDEADTMTVETVDSNATTQSASQSQSQSGNRTGNRKQGKTSEQLRVSGKDRVCEGS
eukprot:TRINITY_DN1300_c0_g1_i1.p2 TRINITY_DN1300_c0_g1~~TRINITY_DN1300_c0_g1_i1.p2  ORF type:complete len:149 (+),score=44.99 TRINITY_DN1300_c0_g1_i1:182-628(+)